MSNKFSNDTPGPSQDHTMRDGNEMTGYDQRVSLDGDATNQARTRYGFDGRVRINNKPAPKPEPTVDAAANAAPKPVVSKPAIINGPKPTPKLKADKSPEFLPAPIVKPKPAPKFKGPSPWKAPRPRPPR